MDTEETLRQVQSKSREIFRDVGGLADDLDGWIEEHTPLRDDEQKAGAIRVSTVRVAMKLAVIRCMFRVIPGIYKPRVTSLLKAQLEAKALAIAGSRIAGSWPGGRLIARLLAAGVAVPDAAQENATLREKLSAVFQTAKKELNAAILAQKTLKRRRDVNTRHFTPPKKRLPKWKSR